MDVSAGVDVAVGIAHPGAMGAVVAAALVDRGLTVWWASAGRSDETRARAEHAGLFDAGTPGDLAQRSDVLLSICPPGAALEVAAGFAGFQGIYVDANAVAPATVQRVADVLSPTAAIVDGGIIGPPPARRGDTRLYLSGHRAGEIRDLFAGSLVDAHVIGGEIGAASALKLAYAAWTKGSAALLMAARDLAAAQGVTSLLIEEWRLSQPALVDELARADASAARKGWRWIAEMEEIAAAMAANGLPEGFHSAAAAMYRAASD